MNSCNCHFVISSRPDWVSHYDNCRSKWDSSARAYPINVDGTIRLLNVHLSKLDHDVLYHLGMDTRSYDLQKLFGDVKFVCMGGTKHRMREFAKYISTELGLGDKDVTTNLTKNSQRYAMYKVGPVLSVSHGVGIPSMTVVLQEVIKLLSYAKAKNPILIRIGTCGGIKLPPGSVVISSFGMNGTLQKSYDLPILGKMQKLPAIFDMRLAQELLSMSEKGDNFNTFLGGTMAADDFYRGQGRLDGPFCGHSEDDKMAFLKKLYELGVRNIEMESTAFAALATEAGLRAADVCVTLLNRLEGDQLCASKSTLTDWQRRPMEIVGRYIKIHCENNRNNIILE